MEYSGKRMRRLLARYCTPAFLSILGLTGCGGANTTASTSPTPTNGAQMVVGVSGRNMTLNGSPWLSRGVVLQAFVRPLSALESESTQKAVLNARENYGETELKQIHAFHADTIRFQIGQPALDPNSPLYDPKYFSAVVNAIQQARQAGFVVMIMMQDEQISGEPTPHPLPTAETESDWDQFIPVFGSDRGVIFELYNEPSLPATAANWQLWLQGGQVPNQTEPAIGMEVLINHIRAKGAENVFVLDGLDLAKTLQGVPAVSDPLNRLVYAVHPYLDGSADESQWDTEFGVQSASIPVWVDEWSAPTHLALGLGTLSSYQVAVDFLNYLQRDSIPLCTGAFDVPQFVVQDIPGWTLTNYENYSDTSTTEGSGTLVYNDYASDYSRTLTLADGL